MVRSGKLEVSVIFNIEQVIQIIGEHYNIIFEVNEHNNELVTYYYIYIDIELVPTILLNY